jgi:nucleoid-associated protein YgaU
VGVLAAATPAVAAPPDPPGPGPASLAGLPLPDRPVDGPQPHEGRTIRVGAGDTLWAIARRQLGPGASGADVTAHWRRVHARNAAEIGPDPDLIRPGQTLRLPEP